MKLLSGAILIFFFTVNGYAQKTDYNKIILPETARDIEFSEKLVQIAWRNHPDNEMVEHVVNVAQYDLKRSRRQWFDALKFVGNLNEFNIDQDRDINNRSQFYPRYNVSATFSLGMFFTIPVDNAQNKARIAIARDQVNSRKLQVRKQVLQTYNTFLMHREIYNLQTLASQEAESSHQLIEERFENGEESIDTYTASINNFNRSKINKLQAERDYLNSKLALEELIGVRLEDVK